MEILSYLDLYLGAFFNVMFCLIIIRKIFNLKIIKNTPKKIVFIIVVAIFVTIINIFNKNTFKGMFVLPLFTILVYEIFDVKLSKSIYCSIVSTFYLLIGELFALLVLSILNIKLDFLISNYLGNSIGNIIAITFTTPLLYIKFLSNIFKRIYNIKITNKTIITIFLLFLLIGSAFAFKSSSDFENTISIIMNTIIFLVFIILLYISYIETRKLSKVSEEYNSLFKYLDKYEKELVEKRKLIHDFKNQLVIINGYAEDNLKLKEYLKSLIDEIKNIKEAKIINNIDKLPKGMKGLIYYKISQIDDNICLNLNVKSKFVEFESLPIKDTRNILKIIGILIDNAIESTTNTNEKYLLIEISMCKGIFKLEIINSCATKIEKNKIMEIGFSTKGKNRGYGLSLVKEIIENDNRYNLNLETEDKKFITYFSINIKKDS